MRSALIVICLSISGTALGADFPVFDVEAGCRRAHGQNVAYSACIDLEQSRYDYSKAMFGTLSQDQQADCVRRLSDIKQYHYAMLSGCIASFAERNRIEVLKQSPSRFRY